MRKFPQLTMMEYKLNAPYSSKTSLLTLYFLDSGSYSSGYLDWFGFFFPTEYDWIHEVIVS
jgi:hypothetical protein